VLRPKIATPMKVTIARDERAMYLEVWRYERQIVLS
jgi:hypothetical protein